MKDFINKLELAFDKQLADKTNYGRNQVKELFLRACIEVLAETDVHVKAAKQIMDNSQYGAINLEHIQKVGRVNRVNETPFKEEGKELTTLLKGNPNFPPKASILRYNSFAFNEVEDAMFIQYRKAPGNNEYMFEVYGHDMEFLVEGWTSIDNPSEDEMIQLYLFYKDLLPF